MAPSAARAVQETPKVAAPRVEEAAHELISVSNMKVVAAHGVVSPRPLLPSAAHRFVLASGLVLFAARAAQEIQNVAAPRVEGASQQLLRCHWVAHPH